MTERILRAGKQAASRFLSRGFTYLGLILVVAIMGILMALAARVWQTSMQREKEAELLFVGDQIETAIGQYYEQSPGGEHQYPVKLEVLLQDSRFPNLKRHLRKIYIDPMTGSRNWGLILSEQGGIQGVFSTSSLPPLKQAGFDEAHKSFEKMRQHSDWKFIYVPSARTVPEADGEDSNPGPMLNE